MIVAGIDVGHLTIKVVALDDMAIAACSVVTAEATVSSEALQILEQTVGNYGASFKDIGFIVCTGSAADAIDFAHKHKSPISCLARAAARYFPSVRTLIDIGAETFTIIKMNAKGRALNFIGNDTCAAGTGIFLDTMAKAMRVSIEEMGSMW